MSLSSMLRGLMEAGVEFVVVGGVAAVANGSPYQTNDLDVCYRTSDENVHRLGAVLRDWNAYPREWEPGLPFVIDRRTFSTTPLLTLITTEGQLNLLDTVAGVGDYEAARGASLILDLFGTELAVLTLDAIIRGKRATGRTKDLAQLPALEALRALADDPGA